MTRRIAPALAAASLLLLAGCPAEEDDRCPAGLFDCGGVCVDLLGDEANCGTCGRACDTGETCSNGLCCDAGLVNCGGACVDTATDALHCGACGQRCGLGACETGGCLCQADPPTVRDCDGNPACVDTASDERYCGSCTNACGANYECISGGCTCPEPPFLLCGTDCADPLTDERHCGECATACPAGATCTGGDCLCPEGEVVCGAAPGACVDTRTDEENCGGCGAACMVGGVCTAGVCECPAALPELCPAQGDLPATCVDIDTDEQNCGVCRRACEDGETCTGGVCCGTGLPVCDSTCCGGGTACCDGLCPYPHQNGLGQSYFSCTPVGTHTRAAAEEAARAWNPDGVAPEFVPNCALDCLGWQTQSACAVWCHDANPLAGRVGLNRLGMDCNVACPNFGSPTWQ
jgi:hypothetical protein